MHNNNLFYYVRMLCYNRSDIKYLLKMQASEMIGATFIIYLTTTK